MPKKNENQTTSKNDQVRKLNEQELKAANAIHDFFRVSRCLLSSDAPEYINQTEEKWPYRAIAQDIAKDMGADWENMTYEQNIALTLNILIEYWGYVEDFKEFDPILKVGFKQD